MIPTVTVDGKAIRVKALNSLTSELQTEVTLIGQKVAIAPDGQTINEGEAFVETLDGNRLPIQPREKLTIGIEFSDSKFIVALPEFIGQKSTRNAFAAGTEEAMKIPLEDRQPLASRKEAEDLGYKL